MHPSILAAAAGLVVAASHGAPSEARQAVAFERAELTTPAQVNALYNEIRAVAHRVCKRAYPTISVVRGRARQAAIADCVAATVEVAIQEAEVAALTALHERIVLAHGPTPPTR